MLIKVCGITRQEDAELAKDLGARALGFNFYPESPRFISPDKAAAIIRSITPPVLSVGIIVKGHTMRLPDEIDIVQVHGFSSVKELPSFDRELWVATPPEGVVSFPDHPVVIDSSWGRGRVADWDLVERIGRGYILSGGLTPENIQGAIGRLKPQGVDVCSGVESAPGIKDPEKLTLFIESAIQAEDGESANEAQRSFA